MTTDRKYPAEWLEKIPAKVFGSLLAGEVRILLHPDSGIADGGAPMNVPVSLIPADLRMPNTLVWVKLDDRMNVVKVWKRDE